MNARERVLAAINHKEPDGIPVDLGSTPSSGISAIAHYNLKHAIGKTHWPTQVYDVVQQIVSTYAGRIAQDFMAVAPPKAGERPV